ncbi:MAG: DNA mismatch repair endonuclease MutL [Flavobacteriaceae bacterium]|nr:DNA mismatch repair endonuclease MutL [Flavobacteriaceae bacterium]
MSDIIQLLPDYVANQIAAGEVVQRPASVVKELLENAIDAKATKVELIIRDAGKNLIQVVDNGIGMSETDARMAFERHATSKIRTTEDIFNIATKGFRGEALASIAAVAQVELKTKKEENEVGTNIYIEGGELQFQEPIQTTKGSNFSVKNLFYNVPARRKFLKKDNIEFRHIIDEFHRVALAHEQIEFSLYHNDEEIFKLRKTNLFQRILDVFGRKLQPHLIPIKEELDWGKLNGFVAKPEGAKKTRGEQFFFVNGRFFKSPYLNRAVQDAFEGILPSGYVPTFFIYLELAPERIDVNIHPQKTEVKFEDEHLIYALILTTVKRSLGIYHIAPPLDFDKNPEMDIFSGVSHSSPKVSKFPEIKINRDYNPFQEEKISPSKINLEEIYGQNIEAEPSKINGLFDDDDFEEELMRLPNGYWLYNKGEKTLMLDMSRVHRAVLLSKRKKQSERNKSGQMLLYSLEYHLNEIEKTKYNGIKKHLAEIGFDMILDQGNVLKINTIPVGLNENKTSIFLERLFDALDYKTEEDFMAFYEEQWVKIQSKSKFDFLYKKDVEELLKEYVSIGFPEYSYGKKCFVELPLEELKNKF